MKHGRDVRQGGPITSTTVLTWTVRQVGALVSETMWLIMELKDDAEYSYNQDDEGYEDEFDEVDQGDEPSGSHGRRGAAQASMPQRRSTRAAVVEASFKRKAAEEPEWRGERRSRRLGALPDTQLDEPPAKRARTEESSVPSQSRSHSAAPSGTGSAAAGPSKNGTNGLKLKLSSAAALKPNEIALDKIKGKRPSKFWVYAVEPAPGATPDSELFPATANGNGVASASYNGHTNGGVNGKGRGHSNTTDASMSAYDDDGSQSAWDRSMEGSLSPVEDESS